MDWGKGERIMTSERAFRRDIEEMSESLGRGCRKHGM